MPVRSGLLHIGSGGMSCLRHAHTLELDLGGTMCSVGGWSASLAPVDADPIMTIFAVRVIRGGPSAMESQWMMK